MLVDQMAEGELAKRMQAAENEIVKTVRYRVRMIETSGIQFSILLPIHGMVSIAASPLAIPEIRVGRSCRIAG